jgi:plastocyanin
MQGGIARLRGRIRRRSHLPSRRGRRANGAAFALLLLVATEALAGTVRGSVTVEGRKGPVEPLGVVICLTSEGSRSPAPRRFEVETRAKQFHPAALAVPTGSTLAFPNHDPILHNVFSVSPGNSFDLGLYGEDESKEVVLATPGPVRIFCNVHAHMAFYALVCPSPHVAAVDEGGLFEIAEVPAGRWIVTAWDERGGEEELEIEVGSAGPTEVELALDATGYKRRQHLDKEGRPYSRRPTEEPYQ